MKRLFFDTETTGTSSNATIFQIAGYIEIDGKVIETFDIKSAPFPDSEINPEALEVTGVTLEQIQKYQEPKQAYKELINIFDKYIDKYNKEDKFDIIGHNVKFDIEKIITWSKKCGDNYIGSYLNWKRIFDTLAFTQCLKVAGIIPETENNKLSTLCKEFGLNLDHAHDAMYDIEATRDLFYVLLKKIKGDSLNV